MLLHALVLVAWLEHTEPPEPYGSRAVELDLVAPRLAVTPVGAAGLDGDPRRARESADAARGHAARSSRRPRAWQSPAEAGARSAAVAAASAEQPTPREWTTRAPAERGAAAAPATDPAAPGMPVRSPRRAEDVARAAAVRSPAPAARSEAARVAPRELATAAEREVPDASVLGLAPDLPPEHDPGALLSAVRAEAAERAERRQQFEEQLAARARRSAARWTRFTAQTGQRRACVPQASQVDGVAVSPSHALSGGGARAAARGARAGTRSDAETTGGNGGDTRYGLRFYLTGRRRVTSRVLHPPELRELPKTTCTVADPDVTPATVRTLVTRDGDIGLAYIRHSSGNQRFDRCALQQVEKLRFVPGRDEELRPLHVWIHIRVSPGLPQHLL